MRIRRLTADDSVAAADLCTQLGYPSTPAQMARRVGLLEAMPGQALLAAEEQMRLVGWVHVQIRCTFESGTFAEICGLVVDERMRGRGVGRALVEAAEDWARKQGHSDLRVRSNVARTRTHRFYQQLGYALAKTSHVFEKRLERTSKP
jgi:GNAT superfamily N-acetyltransferase